jgi:hypothetical protein
LLAETGRPSRDDRRGRWSSLETILSRRLLEITHVPRKFGAVRALCGVVTVGALAAGAQASPAANAAAACSVKTYPGQPVRHTKNLNLKPKYNSFPPTTGTHYLYPLKFNLYPTPLPQLLVVHNLEHGGIAIQYGSKAPRGTAAKIKAWYLRDTNGLIVAPLPELGDKIALTAWNAKPYSGIPPDPGHGIVATCTRFDAAEFTAFVRQHRYKGGERYPKSALARKQ